MVATAENIVDVDLLLADEQPPVLDVDTVLEAMAQFAPQAPQTWGFLDGDKFPGGFGDTVVYDIDYWTLRLRSDQLFRNNLYARGLIRRLITNEINTGLKPECVPEERVLGLEEDSLADWSEDVENRHNIYCMCPELCDYQGKRNFYDLQIEIRIEAIIGGDCLVVIHIDPKTMLPRVEIIPGHRVRTPLDYTPRNGNTITLGIERNRKGRVVAHHVASEEHEGEFLKSTRIPAKGARSGRTVSFMAYGMDMRYEDVRGEPLLSIILQSLKEIDRYRDSAQRKALVGSLLAMYIKRSTDKAAPMPLTGAATRKDTIQVRGDNAAGVKEINLQGQLPGIVFESLAEGMEPAAFGNQATDINFGPFEEAIVSAIAWCNEIPPEILKLAFSNNYSASQAAINELKMYLNRIRSWFGHSVCDPVTKEWFIGQVLTGKIKAPGFLEAWADPMRYDEYNAWLMYDWSGAIKPSTDIKKQADGYEKVRKNGWITDARATREITGMKFSKVIRQQIRENEQKAEALRPILELYKEFGKKEVDDLLGDSAGADIQVDTEDNTE